MKVLVIGGTGTAGAEAVRTLAAWGDEVVVGTRRTGVDALTGKGLAAAMDGVQAVVDASAPASGNRGEAGRFFVTVASNLQRAAAASGVARILTLSIIGIDELSGRAYFDAKLQHEEAARRGSVESVILRCAQFHQFGRLLLQHLRLGPLVGVPIQPVQSVATATVGEYAARLLHDPQPPDQFDLAGPEPGVLLDQVRALIAHDHRNLMAVPLWLPGVAERRIRAGALLAGEQTTCAGPTFAQWLAGDPDAANPSRPGD